MAGGVLLRRLVLAWLWFSSRPAWAQAGSTDHYVDVSVAGSVLVHRDTLASFYNAGPLLQFSLATPYHWGTRAGAGLEVNRYRRTGKDGQDFVGLFPHIRWNRSSGLPADFSWSVGAGLGALIMAFRDAPGARGVHETELEWMVNLELRRVIWRRLSARLTLEYRHAATAPEVSEALAGIGFSTSLTVPAAIRRTLVPSVNTIPPTLQDPRAAGSRELADHLRLLPGWDRSTLDGFGWSLSPRGLTPLESPAWSVFVDGVPIDIGLLGTRDPARLLLPLDYIQVTATGMPMLAATGFAKAGALQFSTSRIPDGLSVGVQGEAGNEVGDPGPFRRTPLEGENMERLGYTPALRGSYRRGGFSAAASYSYQTRGAMSAVLETRDRGFSRGNWYPILRRTAPFFSAGWNRGRTSIRAIAGGSSAEDIFFLAPWGQERAARNTLEYEGLTVSQALAPTLAARGGIARSRNALGSLAIAPETDLDWRTDDVKSWIEIAGPRHVQAGVSLERRSASTHYELADSADRFWRLYAEREAGAAAGWSWSAGGELTGSRGSWRPSIMGALQWRGIGDGSAAGLRVSRMQSLPAEPGTFWLWARRGYDIIQEAGGVVDIAVPATEKLLTIDASLQRPVGERGGIRIEPFWRHANGLTLPTTVFAWDSGTRRFTGPVNAVSDAGGSVAGFLASIEQQFPGAGEARFSYRYQRAVGGTTAFREAWEASPMHFARLEAVLAPAPDLTLWSLLEYQGRRRWPRWSIPADPPAAWSAVVPGYFACEMTLRKLFAGRRFETRITIRAPLRGLNRYQAIGIQSRLQIWVGGAFRLEQTAG